MELAKFKQDLERLQQLGGEMYADLFLERGSLSDEQKQRKKAVSGAFAREYQRWYSEAVAVVRQVLPDRCDEFRTIYEGQPRRKDLVAINYAIQDWLLGRRSAKGHAASFDDHAAVVMQFQVQRAILDSADARFTSSLFEIRQIVQADLFDSELDAARGLAKAGFLRPAGVVSGVVLEKHLQEVCVTHNIVVKKNPTISDLNDALKNANTIDVPTWRHIQRLGDLRNLCGHNKDREPTKDESMELIDVTDKMIKSIF